jgi:hypothetical protein
MRTNHLSSEVRWKLTDGLLFRDEVKFSHHADPFPGVAGVSLRRREGDGDGPTPASLVPQKCAICGTGGNSLCHRVSSRVGCIYDGKKALCYYFYV